MGEKQQPTAFISHTEADWGRFVRPFSAALRARDGVEARVYKWEKKAGRENYIAMARQADVFVPVLSAASVRAAGVLAEINAVTDKIVNTPERVIPVILDNLPKAQFPDSLQGLEYVRGAPRQDAAAAATEVARLIRGEAHPDKPPVKVGGDGFSFFAQLARTVPPAFKLGILLQMAEAGSAIAQTALGGMYYEGEGVPQNYKKAANWLRRAAGQEFVLAQFNLGVAYHLGQGVRRNDAKAAEWWRRAAEQEFALAQFNLGVVYHFGQGVRRNDAKAAEWWQCAAEQGIAQAQSNLGVLYSQGKGVPQNYKEAVKWFRRAVRQGDAKAQSNLGGLYHEGKGVPQDDGKAVKWWQRAAAQGNAQAQYNLGNMSHMGKGILQSDAEATKWWRKAAEQGYAQAQYNLGIAYRLGDGVARDYEESAKWMRRAAEQGLAKALEELRESEDGGE